MKYSELYPNMKPLDEKDNILRGTTKMSCFTCGCPTEYAEINYEAPFCSEECLALFEMTIKEEMHSHD